MNIRRTAPVVIRFALLRITAAEGAVISQALACACGLAARDVER